MAFSLILLDLSHPSTPSMTSRIDREIKFLVLNCTNQKAHHHRPYVPQLRPHFCHCSDHVQAYSALWLGLLDLSTRGGLSVVVVQSLSHVWLFATQWTVACQNPLSMGFSRQEYWSGLPCPPPGDHPHLRIELVSAYVSCIASRFFTHWATWEAPLST